MQCPPSAAVVVALAHAEEQQVHLTMTPEAAWAWLPLEAISGTFSASSVAYRLAC